MAAYRKSFTDGKGILVLKPDSEFLKYFNTAAPR
jgi:membrane protease subunit HflC